jgi:hypothetical protein
MILCFQQARCYNAFPTTTVDVSYLAVSLLPVEDASCIAVLQQRRVSASNQFKSIPLTYHQCLRDHSRARGYRRFCMERCRVVFIRSVTLPLTTATSMTAQQTPLLLLAAQPRPFLGYTRATGISIMIGLWSVTVADRLIGR